MSDLTASLFGSTAANAAWPCALAGADVGLLVGDEVRRGEEAVLEIVDAHLGGFTIGHGAEVRR